MNSRYNHHQQQQQQQQHRIRISSIFMPMLCSRSDASHPRSDRRLSDKGVSPEVGCMGQRKKRSIRSRVSSSFSSSQSDRSASDSTPTHRRYSKLRKIFSGKNLAAANSGSTICRGGGMMISRSRGQRIAVVRNEETSSGEIDINGMDPPLPVIKKGQQEVGQGENLWKRRCAVKGLQLQQIQVATV